MKYYFETGELILRDILPADEEAFFDVEKYQMRLDENYQRRMAKPK